MAKVETPELMVHLLATVIETVAEVRALRRCIEANGIVISEEQFDEEMERARLDLIRREAEDDDSPVAELYRALHLMRPGAP